MLNISFKLWFCHDLLEKQIRPMQHEIKQRVSGGQLATRVDTDEVTQGAECLHEARSLDMDPGGMRTPYDPLHHQTIWLAATITLGKENPWGVGQPLAPQKALNDIFLSEMEHLNWTLERASDSRYGWPLCNSTGVMSFTGSFIRDIGFLSGQSFIRPGVH